MAATAPPVITALPTPPDPNDRSTFNTRAYPWSVAQQTLATEANAVAANVFANAQEAKTQAEAATTNGAAQVALATAQADAATTKAGEASTSAASAASSATAALASKNAAAASAADSEASRIAASKLNLGNKAAPPAADNQGAALLAGATYYDTTLNKWRVWNGSAWTDGISAVAGVTSVNGQTGVLTGFVTDTGVQTLANKTLTDPKITLGGTNGAAGQVPVSQGAGLPPVWGAKQDTLVSGTNIKTINGSSVLGSGDLAVGGGSLILLSTVTANNSATVNLETGFGSEYDEYLVVFSGVGRSVSSAGMYARVKVAGAYTTTSIYRNALIFGNSGGGGANADIYLSGGEGSDANHFGEFRLFGANGSNYKGVFSRYCPGFIPGSPAAPYHYASSIETTSAIQGVQFKFSSGLITTGTFRLYGFKKN